MIEQQEAEAERSGDSDNELNKYIERAMNERPKISDSLKNLIAVIIAQKFVLFG